MTEACAAELPRLPVVSCFAAAAWYKRSTMLAKSPDFYLKWAMCRARMTGKFGLVAQREVKLGFMNGDMTDKSTDSAGLTESGTRGLLGEIAATLSYLSSENRDQRRRQKLREALVREYIEDKNPPPSILQSVTARLGK